MGYAALGGGEATGVAFSFGDLDLTGWPTATKLVDGCLQRSASAAGGLG
jgi:hypothetical protein